MSLRGINVRWIGLYVITWGLVGFLIVGGVRWAWGNGAIWADSSDKNALIWAVGDTIAIASPDNPAQSFNLTVLAIAPGGYTIADPDGDVFTCTGRIALETCTVSPTLTTQNTPPVGWVDIPTCQPGRRLWVQMAGDRITGYECR